MFQWYLQHDYRSGYVSTDIGLEDTSESFGLPSNNDFMFALISSEELQESTDTSKTVEK